LKKIRFKFAQDNIFRNIGDVIFMDESSMKTNRSGLYINRKKTSSPKCDGIHPRNVKTVHIISGVNLEGPIFVKVGNFKITIESIFCLFKFFTKSLTSFGYEILLEKHIFPAIRAKFGNDFIIIQDNDLLSIEHTLEDSYSSE